MRRAAIASTEEWRWRAYGHLTHSVRTGKPGFPLAHGCGVSEYLAREPDAAASGAEQRIVFAKDAGRPAAVQSSWEKACGDETKLFRRAATLVDFDRRIEFGDSRVRFRADCSAVDLLVCGGDRADVIAASHARSAPFGVD